MRFYNHSTIPGELLKPLVKHALQLSKINPKVIVLITRSKRGGGMAYDCRGVSDSHLSKRRPKPRHKKYLPCKGRIEVAVLRRFHSTMKKTPAEWFFEVLLHEFGHLDSYQKDMRFLDRKPFNRKKMKWEDRPSEEYANRFALKILKNLSPGNRRKFEENANNLDNWILEQEKGA